MQRSSRSARQAFTIVELLIVVVVIAILAAISMVAYQGIQQRARLSAVKAATVQMQKSLDLVKAESDNYPTSINSCPVPAAGSACMPVPGGFNVTYERIAEGVRPSPVYAGMTSAQSYEYTLRSDTSVVYYSNSERTGTNEFVQYMNMAPIIDQYGLVPYQISFDIKSADTTSASTANVYMQNGGGSKYGFGVSVPVTTSYVRKTITVTPTLVSGSTADSVLAFYGTYSTGNILSVKNLEIIRVN